MTKLKALIVVSIVAIPLQLSAQAESKNPREASGAKAPGNENTSQTTQAQKQFEQQTLAKLHQINKHEIEAGHLAQQRGQSDDVKNYGQMLANDHQQLDSNVVSFVERNNVPLPDAENGAGAASPKAQAELKQMKQEQQAHAQKLESTPDEQFDREFVRAMVKGHQQAIQLVQSAQKQAKDDQFKNLLNDTLPVLKKHLETAQRLQTQASGKMPKTIDESKSKTQ